MAIPQNVKDELLNFTFPPNFFPYVNLASIDDNDEVDYQNLVATEEVFTEFLDIMRSVISKLNRANQRGNLDWVEYEAGMKLDNHEVAYLNATDFDTIMERVNGTSAEAPNFDNDEEFVRNLRYYSIVVDDDFKFFRIFSAKKELAKSYKWVAYWNGQIFSKIQEDAFILEEKIDCIFFKDYMIILNGFYFTQMFDFYQLL